MSTSRLKCRFAFGYSPNVRNGIHFTENNKAVIHPAGHGVAIVSVSKDQPGGYISGSPNSTGLSAIAMSSDKQLIAIAENSTKGFLVNVYDMNKPDEPIETLCGSEEEPDILSLAFCSDKSRILTLSGKKSEMSMSMWDWKGEKKKRVVRSKTKVYKDETILHLSCGTSPEDRTACCLVGGNVVKLFRAVEQDEIFHPIIGAKTPSYSKTVYGDAVCHTWATKSRGRLFVGTSKGNVVLIESGEILGVVKCTRDIAVPIYSIFSTASGGIVCGCAKSTLIRVVAKENSSTNTSPLEAFELKDTRLVANVEKQRDEEEEYDEEEDEQNDMIKSSAIVGLAVSSATSRVVCALDSKQILVVKENSRGIGNVVRNEVSISPLNNGFHTRVGVSSSAAITGMDVCLKRPLVVTCGADSCVRVWNYLEGTCELEQHFAEETLSVAIHPSGHQILVGFADKLRLMSLLYDSLASLKEITIKHCRECRFSRGGQLFACAYNNAIHVYRTYSCVQIQKLTGHNGKVQSLTWADGDSKIISSGLGGSIYVWSVKDGKRVDEYVKKGIKFTSAASDSSAKAIYAVGDDKHLKKLELPDAKISGDISAGSVLNRVVLGNTGRYPLLYASTAPRSSFLTKSSNATTAKTGGGERDDKKRDNSSLHSSYKPSSIRIFRSLDLSEAGSVPAVDGRVTHLGISCDDNYLFVAGEDGTLLIYDTEKRMRSEEDRTEYCSNILMMKSELEDRRSSIAELDAKVQELEMHNEYQLRVKDMTYAEQMKNITENAQEDMRTERKKYEELEHEKARTETRHREELMKLRDIQHHELQRIEAEYQQMIMSQVELYQELKQEVASESKRIAKDQDTLIESNEKEVRMAAIENQKKIETVRSLRNRAEEELGLTRRTCDEEATQLNTDIDVEIQDLKRKYENMLDAERVATLRFKGENGLMRKKFSALNKDIELQHEEIKAMLDKERKLHSHISVLKREIKGLREIVQDRDVEIGKKEKLIYDMKKKNQELEKFKFVLDFKIKELKRQIEPRENEIKDLKDKIRGRDAELERYHNSNASLDKSIGELRLRLNTLQRNVLANRTQLGVKRKYINSFRCDLHKVATQAHEMETLKSSVIEIYKKYVNSSKEDVDTKMMDENVQKECERQRSYMKKSICKLKRNIASEAESQKSENRKHIKENMELINEIADLRKKIKGVKFGVRGDVFDEVQPETLTMLENGRQKLEELQRAVLKVRRGKVGGLEPLLLTQQRPTSQGGVGGSLPEMG